MSVVLHAKPSLMDASGKWLGYIDDGQSIADIIDLFQVSDDTKSHLVVHIGDRFVDRNAWSMITPKPDMRVTVSYAYRGDSGKQILAMVAMIGLSIFAPYLAGTLMGLTQGTLAYSAVVLGTMLVGSLLISALFPPPDQPESEEGGSHLSFSGFSNKARPDEGVMRIFGKLRVFPDIIALPYTTVDNGFDYITTVFGYGYAEIDISDTRIGIFDGDDVKELNLLTTARYSNGDLAMYPNDVWQESTSITLTSDDEVVGQDEKPLLDKNWYVLKSEANADQISIDFAFPEGLVYTKPDEDPDNMPRNIWLYYRAVGSSTWLEVHDLPNVLTGPSGSMNWLYTVDRGWYVEINLKAMYSFSTNITIDMPSRGRYEFNIAGNKWSTEDTRRNSRVVLQYFRTVTYENPINSAIDITIQQMHVRATNQFSGAIDDLSSMCEAKIPVIESGVWVAPKLSSNPAWIYLSILKSPSNKNAIDDYEIDLESFIDWAAYCDQTLDSETFITCNVAHIGTETVDQMLQKVAACGNASRTTRDGKQSIIWDAVHDYPTQVFTQRNSWGFKLDKGFAEHPHGLIIRYLDDQNDYKQDEVIVYSPGYDVTNAEKFEHLEAFGCTVTAQAERFGLRYLAMGRYRSEFFSFYADVENLASERGDRIRVSYDAVKEGGKAARIMELLKTGDDVTGVRLDQKHYATFNYSEHHGLLVRTVNNDEPLIFVQEVDSVIDEYSLQFVTPVSAYIEAGNIVVFGEIEEISEDYLITKINPGADLTAQIECTPYASEMQELRNGGTETNTCGMSVVALPERADVLEDVNFSLRHDIDNVASVAWSLPGSDTPTSNLEFLTATYAVAGVYVATCSVTYVGGTNCQDTATITIG